MPIFYYSLFSSIYSKKAYGFTHVNPKHLCQEKDTGALVESNEVLPTGTACSIIRDAHAGEKPRAQTTGTVSVPSTMKQQINNVSINGV